MEDLDNEEAERADELYWDEDYYGEYYDDEDFDDFYDSFFNEGAMNI